MYSRFEDLDIDKLRYQAQMIHYFGLGFIQIKMNEQHRLHVYIPDLPSIVSSESVHNHRYDFSSIVLAGVLFQDIFAVVSGETHILEDDACTEGMKSNKPPEPCAVSLLSSQNFVAGSRYYIHKDVYHTVDTTTNAITLLSRGEKTKQFAQVVTPVDAPKVCPFSKKIPEEELWERVAEALASHT